MKTFENIPTLSDLVFTKLEIIRRPLENRRFVMQLDEEHAISYMDLSYWFPARLELIYKDVKLEIRRTDWFYRNYEVKQNGKLVLKVKNTFQQLQFDYEGQSYYTVLPMALTTSGLIIYRKGDPPKQPVLKLQLRYQKFSLKGLVIINQPELNEQFLHSMIGACFYHLFLNLQNG
ncbi:MAG: hypothetical protein AAF598_19800 [Bacteroidota bacterium]